jgi:hypothetical protein
MDPEPTSKVASIGMASLEKGTLEKVLARIQTLSETRQNPDIITIPKENT